MKLIYVTEFFLEHLRALVAGGCSRSEAMSVIARCCGNDYRVLTALGLVEIQRKLMIVAQANIIEP